MTNWIALFRGVNVGGKNKMPMARLRTMLDSLGCRNVRTYIQSGNVVFASKARSCANLERQILDATAREFGFRPELMLLTELQFRDSISRNPFREAEAEPKTLHFFFVQSASVNPDWDGIARIALPSESYELVGTVFYLHTPAGFGTSKLAAAVERKLGASATARNFNTVEALVGLLDCS